MHAAHSGSLLDHILKAVELSVAPFQVAPRTYYVSGQRWVGAYLIDTGEGCILIDTAVSESAPLRDRFIADAERVAAIPVDIALPSHPNQIDIMDRAGSYTDASQPFLDRTVWQDFIRERVHQVREYDPTPQLRLQL